MSRCRYKGKSTIIECAWCDEWIVVESLDAETVARGVADAGWSTGWACSRGRNGKGCQQLDLCPSCTPGGAP